MTEYLTEQEQIQQLKQLARQYIPAVLVGLVLAFAVSSGWRALQRYQDNIRTEASAVYEDMLTAEDQNNIDSAVAAAKKLTVHYPRTIYASLAALMLARDAIARSDLTEAEQQLNTILKRGKKTGLWSIARIRLARVKVAEGDAKSALGLLNDDVDPAFSGLANAVRGDALAADKQPAAAMKAYQLALKQIPDTNWLNTLLQMKFDNLSGTTGNRI